MHLISALSIRSLPWSCPFLLLLSRFQFAEEVYPTGLDIFETFNAGHTVRVSIQDGRGTWHLLWSGEIDTIASAAPKARIFSPPICPSQIKSKVLRIDLASPGDTWAEIDAVKLRGVTRLDPTIITNLDYRVHYKPNKYFDDTDTFSFIANDCVYYNLVWPFLLPSLPHCTFVLTRVCVHSSVIVSSPPLRLPSK